MRVLLGIFVLLWVLVLWMTLVPNFLYLIVGAWLLFLLVFTVKGSIYNWRNPR